MMVCIKLKAGESPRQGTKMKYALCTRPVVLAALILPFLFSGSAFSRELHAPNAAVLKLEDNSALVGAASPAPLLFIENVGQFDSRVRFQVRGAGGTIFLTDDALWFTVLQPEP